LITGGFSIVNKKKDDWDWDIPDIPDIPEDAYKEFIWEKMIARERPDLTPEDEEYQVLKQQMDEAWQKEKEMMNHADALDWIEGMNKIPVQEWDKDLKWMDTQRAAGIFQCLGAKFLEMVCDKLGISYESLTIERKLATTGAIKDYTSIIAWIASNTDRIEEKEPYGTE